MSKKPCTSRTNGRFIRRLLLVSLVAFISFGLAMSIAAVVAARLLLPVAAAGLKGLTEMVAATATEIQVGLNDGDSQQRLTILTQLKDSLGPSNALAADPQFSAWITPALERCQADGDPEVIALADEILQMLDSGTESM